MESSAPGWEEVEKLLEEEGIEVPRDASGKIAAFTALIRQFGKAMNLVSRGDLGALWTRHVVDSLSLAPWVYRLADGGMVADLGTGGGFPALVLKAVLPEQRMILVERSERKAGFLRMAAAQLGYVRLEVACTDVHRWDPPEPPALITSRAIERPHEIASVLRNQIGSGAVWLCQQGSREAEWFRGFEVHDIEGGWSKRGWRRGCLYVVRQGAS
jgi:16S rRNA (guanine527-N7)-methyltransferase